MNLLDVLNQSGRGAPVRQLAQQFGLGESQAQSALGALLPALARGLQRNAGSADGLAALRGAVERGGHDRYVDDPRQLAAPGARDEGNAILGHILGSKDVSRNVAGNAAQQTGIDAGVLRQMLPAIAALAMGALGKQSSAGGGLLDALGGASGGGGNLLSQFLDADGDGSALDDVLGMAKKFF